MSITRQLLIFVTLVSINRASIIDVFKAEHCPESSKNVTDHSPGQCPELLGTWHVLYYIKEAEEERCIHISTFNDEERKNMSARIGKLANGVKWDDVILKMQVPCDSVQSNETQIYLLEKLKGKGSFRLFEMPASNDIASNDVGMYPMRLMIFKDRYLGLVYCNKLVLAMDSTSPRAEDFDTVIETIEKYWREFKGI